MHSNDDYWAEIARSRKDESESRDRRRALRNEYQERLTKARQTHARKCFLSDVHFHIARRSIAEENVMYKVRTAAACWVDVCERAITRQLDVEATEKAHAQRDTDFLERTRQREMQEQRNTEESDATRWRELNARYAMQKKIDCAQTVKDTISAMWNRTEHCLDNLHRCRLDHAGTPLLVAFSTDASLLALAPPAAEHPTTAAAAPTSLFASFSTSEAFRNIFHGCPYLQSSSALLSLLQYCYSCCPIPSTSTDALQLSPAPVLVVNGPKYSGKTMLAEFLGSKFKLLHISDESLVQRALEAAEEAQHAVNSHAAATPLDGVSEAAGQGASAQAWAMYGERIRAALLAGEGVSASLVVELLYLQFSEVLALDSSAVPYDAILLEGVFRSLDTHNSMTQRLGTMTVHPYTRLARRWHLGGSQQDADVAAAAASARSAGEAAAAAAEAAREIPPLLRLPDRIASEHDTPAKLETKARPMKKVDLAALPPADLPEVDDTHEAQARERRFIAQADHELSTLPTFLSGYLYIHCDPEEIFRRFAGLRVDLETGKVYHLTYNPPPADRLAHVVSLGRPDTSSVQLHKAVFHHKEEWAAARKWLTQRPTDSKFARVYELNGNGDIQSVHQEALQAVEQIIANFRIGRQVLQEREAAATRLAQLEAVQVAQTSAREAERQRLMSIYIEKGVPLPPHLITPMDGSGNSASTLSSAAAEVILQAAFDFTVEYEEDYGTVWQHTTQLVQLLLQYYNGAEEKMAAYWQRPDDKQAILHRFQSGFDATPPALRAQPACKAELHVVLDELADALHHCIALRDAEAKGLLDTLCSPGNFLAGWETRVCQEFARLVQCEAQRFVLALHIFTFYFGATTGEALAFDEVEIEVPSMSVNMADRPVHTPGAPATTAGDTAAAASASPSSLPRAGKEKRAATSKKAHGKTTEESFEKSVEDQFGEVVQGVLTGIGSVTDKLKGLLDAQTKGQKRTNGLSTSTNSSSGASTSFLVCVAVKCWELMEAERAAAVTRVTAIHTCVQTLLREAETHVQQRRAHMEALLTSQMAMEAAAANSAVYALRGCIEMERKSPKMHLGCTTFAVLQDDAVPPQSPTRRSGATTERPARRSFLTDVPLTSQLPDAQLLLHAGLPAARLLHLVQQFRCVAPDYQLSRFDFFLFVEDHDYAQAAAVRLDNARNAVKTREELFQSFDPQRTGFLDWRDLVVHLLFWLTPATVSASSANPTAATASTTGIPEITLQDLLDIRASLGISPLSEEAFFDLPFFYDRYLNDTRLEAYTRVLWNTFCDPVKQTLDPYVLLGFLCADPQPVRGAQKAFRLLSAITSPGCLSLEEMDAVCHLKATNARVMAQPDPCSKMYLRLLFGSATTCSFEEVCMSPIGRKMLNYADLFHRRSFVRRK